MVFDDLDSCGGNGGSWGGLEVGFVKDGEFESFRYKLGHCKATGQELHEFLQHIRDEHEISRCLARIAYKNLSNLSGCLAVASKQQD